MSSKVKISASVALALVALWAVWFFQTERDYGTEAKKLQLEEFKIPFETVPEQVAFIRDLGKKDDEEFLGITNRINFSDHVRLIYFEYVQALGTKPSDRRTQRLEQIAASDEPDSAAHARLVLLKIDDKDAWPAKAGELLKSLEGMSSDGRVHVFNLLLNQMGENKVWLADLRNYIYTSKHNETVALGLRHLASLKDKWVGENIAYFLRHNEPSVRAAAVQSLSYYCSVDAEKFLTEISRNENDPEVLIRVIDEVVEFPKLKLQAMYLDVAHRFPRHNRIQQKIKENLARFQAGEVRPACHLE